MICPTCSQPIPDALLDCPACLAAKSYQALLEQQKPIIGRIQKGEYKLTLAKQAEEKNWHLVLANYPQAWCGKTLKTGWKRIRPVAWPRVDRSTPVCDHCRRVFDEIAEA